MNRKILTALLCLTWLLPSAHAGLLEDLLAVPAIQSLLGRQPDIQTVLKRCADAKFRQANAASCQQAEQADRLSRVPAELRAVLAVPASAASLRELCLSVQAGQLRNSHLCTELGKADQSFLALADQQRRAAAAAEKARKDAEAASNRAEIN
jgi:hypothetical protein